MNKMKWLAFDIETESWPGGEDHRRDLGVTCLAWAMGESVFHLPAFDAGFLPQMSERKLGGFVERLVESVDDGCKIATINGLGFDFPVLAEAVPHMRADLKALALGSYDPAFQMLCEKGFMIGLDALAVGLELTERKTKGMSGALAVELWESDDPDLQRQVIEYVRQDARVTLGIVQALESGRWTWEQYDHQLRGNVQYDERQAIRWQTKKGSISHHCLDHGLLTVRECLELPLPNTGWMDDPWPREKFSGWLQGEIDVS